MRRLAPAFAAVLLCCGTVCAQNYPSKPIRFILPFPPGGGTDTLARIVGQKLGENLAQTIVLDNRPGAGANIGAEIGAHSVPDGYTLVMGNIAHAINMTLYKKPGYDIVTDFAPITLLASTPNILVVHPSVAAKSVQELIARGYQHLQAEARVNLAAEENVLFAIENLKTYPVVQTRLANGSLHLHGWFFEIATAELFAFHPETKQFEPFVRPGQTPP